MGLGLGLRAKLDRARKEVHYFAKNKLKRPRLYDIASAERVGCIYREPSDMPITDRIMLYALVRGLRPKTAVEIGVRWGGSARIITNAMEENGVGHLVGIDPVVKAFRVPERELHGRYTLIEGYSPQETPQARIMLGAPIEFAFIDGLHTFDACSKDIAGVIPFLAPGAHVLLHDTYHQGIDQAARQACEANRQLVDCGFITRNADAALPVCGDGLRLLRYGPVDSEALITEAYQRADMKVPPFSSDYWNRDAYLERITKRQATEKRQQPV